MKDFSKCSKSELLEALELLQAQYQDDVLLMKEARLRYSSSGILDLEREMKRILSLMDWAREELDERFGGR